MNKTKPTAFAIIICLFYFASAFRCNNSNNDSTRTRDDESNNTESTQDGAITKEEVKAYLFNQLKDICESSGYKNPVVRIEKFQHYPRIKFDKTNLYTYPVKYDWTRSYEDYAGKRIEHHKGDYARFMRNVDTGKWEIVGGENGEETIEDIPANQ